MRRECGPFLLYPTTVAAVEEVDDLDSGDSRTQRPELTPKWIASLSKEKAILSKISVENTTFMVRKIKKNNYKKTAHNGVLVDQNGKHLQAFLQPKGQLMKIHLLLGSGIK
ncbi:unnamed protein product [Dovyalis caffra]|uniref:Uncharacterized protein n=1 Tax=Dovyalis caffra TaxID=77055 RepID=A0AAV1RZ42_9ROSI|nr:unnamed protein product [Dovyalis caffra]